MIFFHPLLKLMLQTISMTLISKSVCVYQAFSFHSSEPFFSGSHRAVLAGAEAAGRDAAPHRDLRPPQLLQQRRRAGGPEGASAV